MNSNIRNIYDDPEVYDAAHWWKTNDIDFICDLCETLGDPILELGAGTGRLAQPLLARGLNYLGLDNSPAYVEWAGKKLSDFPSGKIISGDMRSFSLPQSFQTCFIGFNSIFHLMNNADIRSCFTSVFRHLNPGGYFFIDMFYPDPAFLFREAKSYPVMEFNHPRFGPCKVEETNEYDSATQINVITWYFHYTESERTDRYTFAMHMIFPDTMFHVLNEAGFIIQSMWGGYDKTPFTEDSDLQIYLCRKPEA